jgi:hypothetical protein
MLPLLPAPAIAGLLPAGKPLKDTRGKALKRLQKLGFDALLARHYKGADANVFVITVNTPDIAAISAYKQMILRAGFYPAQLGISRAFLSDNRMIAFSIDFAA